MVTSENQKNAFGAAPERMNEEQNLENNRLEHLRLSRKQSWQTTRNDFK